MVDSRKIDNIRVVGIQKKKDHFSKHYEFILKVTWNDKTEVTIYRPYSMFFDFQGVLCQMFQDKCKVSIPSVPAAKFHWVLLGKLGVEKECKALEEFCQKIIYLPNTVSESSAVLHFFDAWGTDIRAYNQQHDELMHTIGSPVIQSQEHPSNPAQEAINTVPSGDTENQFRAIATYDANNFGEVSFEENSIVTVVEKTERGWWFVSNDQGCQGWAPATYLEPLSEEDEFALEELIPLENESEGGEAYVTVVDYSAQNMDEISYKCGEQVEVIAKSNYGWWKIRHKGEIGLTPATNLCRKDSQSSSSPIEFGRTLSISSTSGLYAVIRKPPPRRDTVRKSKKSGKKPSRIVYSAASFSGGKFSFDDDRNRTFQASKQGHDEGKSGSDDERLQSQSYENIEVHSPKSGRPGRGGRNSEDASKDGDTLKGQGPEYYKVLADYYPGPGRTEDITLHQGDIVQFISVDGNWFFVMLRKTGDERQGWVPATYLERKLDISSERLDKHEGIPQAKPKPKPRPYAKNRRPSDDIEKPPSPVTTPVPHPRQRICSEDLEKPSSPSVNQVRHGRAKKSSLPNELDDISSIDTSSIQHRPPAPPPPETERRKQSSPAVLIHDENIYDEPAPPVLRSVYDAEPWFHGKISRQDCEHLLKTHGRQQDFLVRESQRGSGSYALSVKYCYRIRHFPIETSSDGKLVIGKLNFKNLMDLVTYYQEYPLFYSEHKEPITLGHPFEKK